MQSSRAQRCHDANAAHTLGERLFALGFKKTFSLQKCFEQHKLLIQIALASFRHRFHDQLQLATWFVHPQATRHFHPLALARHKRQTRSSAFEHGAAQLPAAVLERKIAMPAGGAHKTADFTRYTHRVEARVQSVGNGVAQSADRPNLRSGAAYWQDF